YHVSANPVEAFAFGIRILAVVDIEVLIVAAKAEMAALDRILFPVGMCGSATVRNLPDVSKCGGIVRMFDRFSALKHEYLQTFGAQFPCSPATTDSRTHDNSIKRHGILTLTGIIHF